MSSSIIVVSSVAGALILDVVKSTGAVFFVRVGFVASTIGVSGNLVNFTGQAVDIVMVSVVVDSIVRGICLVAVPVGVQQITLCVEIGSVIGTHRVVMAELG
jgi:hypothetical protein